MPGFYSHTCHPRQPQISGILAMVLTAPVRDSRAYYPSWTRVTDSAAQSLPNKIRCATSVSSGVDPSVSA